MKSDIIIYPVGKINNLDELAKQSSYKYENGYISCLIRVNFGEDCASVLSFVLDKDNKLVVPARIISSSYEQDRLLLVFRTLILDNKKAIYASKLDEYCLIDIENTDYDENLNPTNPLFKFKGFYMINDSKLMVLVDKRWRLYDVITNSFSSFVFDDVNFNFEDDLLYGIIRYDINSEEYYICCAIDKKGEMKNEINFGFRDYIVPKDVLKNIDLLKKYINENIYSSKQRVYSIGKNIC